MMLGFFFWYLIKLTIVIGSMNLHTLVVVASSYRLEKIVLSVSLVKGTPLIYQILVLSSALLI